MSRRAQIDDQLVGITGRRPLEFGLPERRGIAVGGAAGFESGGMPVGRDADGGVDSVVLPAGVSNPVEDRTIGGMLGVLPARAADVSEAGGTVRIFASLALRAPRLAEQQARLGLAKVHDLERGLIVDRGVLSDPENRVVRMALGARPAVGAGLEEQGFHGAAERVEAQEPRPREVRRRRSIRPDRDPKRGAGRRLSRPGAGRS